jgi:hypothetical protein
VVLLRTPALRPALIGIGPKDELEGMMAAQGSFD